MKNKNKLINRNKNEKLNFDYTCIPNAKSANKNTANFRVGTIFFSIPTPITAKRNERARLLLVSKQQANEFIRT